MMWDLPVDVEINGKNHPIRNKCDYRVVLDVFCALKDDDLNVYEKIWCAMSIFYESIDEIGEEDYAVAMEEMFRIISGGKFEETSENKPSLMDWEHDFPQLAPPISRVLGYDIRTPNTYCHFWTFLGAYMEIGECVFSNIISIRAKKFKRKKLEKWEEEFYKEHKKMIDLPKKLTTEEIEWLNSEW